MAARKNAGGGKGQDKLWSDAVRRAVNEIQGGKRSGEKKLVLLARKLVEQALEGDIAALKEIGDRLDGKPSQVVQGSGSDGAFVHKVEVEIVGSARSDS